MSVEPGAVGVRHWIYFDSERACRNAGARLAADGLPVDLFREHEEWCLCATETMVVTDESIAAVQARMELFVAEVGGDYRSCEVPMPRLTEEELANVEVIDVGVLEQLDTTPGVRGVLRRWRHRLWRWILGFR